MARLDDIVARKQLLVAQAEFDRLKLAMAVHDVRRIVRPSVGAGQRAGAYSTASRLIGFALPVLGRSRVGRVLRALSIGLAVYRFFRGMRR
jgi:hypothetical protein